MEMLKFNRYPYSHYISALFLSCCFCKATLRTDNVQFLQGQKRRNLDCLAHARDMSC